MVSRLWRRHEQVYLIGQLQVTCCAHLSYIHEAINLLRCSVQTLDLQVMAFKRKKQILEASLEASFSSKF